MPTIKKPTKVVKKSATSKKVAPKKPVAKKATTSKKVAPVVRTEVIKVSDLFRAIDVTGVACVSRGHAQEVSHAMNLLIEYLGIFDAYVEDTINNALNKEYRKAISEEANALVESGVVLTEEQQEKISNMVLALDEELDQRAKGCGKNCTCR